MTELERRIAEGGGVLPDFAWLEDGMLEIRFGRHNLRYCIINPVRHSGEWLAELLGYSGA